MGDEGVEYDYVYRNSIVKASIIIALGLMCFGGAIYISITPSLHYGYTLLMPGACLLLLGGMNYFDKAPRLKISKYGLWTNKLGFQPWENIKEAIAEDRENYKHRNYCLYITLKQNNSDQSDDILNLDELNDTGSINQKIDDCRLWWQCNVEMTLKEQGKL